MTRPAIHRVVATDVAENFIRLLSERHGPLMFFQSGGCCDGSSPMCYALGDFSIGNTDVFLGKLCGQPFYMGAD